MPFVASSPNYGLADQIENPWGPGCVSLSGPGNAAGRTWYESEGMPIFAYSSLARGLFSGRVTRSNFDETREMLDGACQRAYCHEPNLKRLDRAHELAAEKGITVPQLVLAFMYASPLDVFPIVGAANGDEYAENIKAFDVALTPTECAWLDLKSDSR